MNKYLMKCTSCTKEAKFMVSCKEYCRQCYFDKLLSFVNKANINLELKSKIQSCGPNCYCIKKR